MAHDMWKLEKKLPVRVIAFLGDSLTAGVDWGTLLGVSGITNAGVGGDKGLDS